jgi:hypothetical protein
MEILVRNAPCPCGSGRKYKRCHGMEVSKAGLQENAKIIPFVVYQPFAPHGISPWVAQAMKRASSQ